MNIIEQIGDYMLLMRKVFTFPQKWRVFFRQLIIEIDSLGIQSIGLIALISIFMGAVINIQMCNNLGNLPTYIIGYSTRESFILEFCSTVIALILTGKIGSSIASQIGAMRITEQIEAMELMGINSANYLILPKAIALMLFIPLVTVFSIVLGLLGGLGTIYFIKAITVSEYIEGIQHEFQPFYVYYSIIKSIVFAFIITTGSAYYGYIPKNNTGEVALYSTKAVVVVSINILLMNLLLTKILL